MGEADLMQAYATLRDNVYLPTFITKLAEAGLEVRHTDVGELLRIADMLRGANEKVAEANQGWSQGIREGLERLTGGGAAVKESEDRYVASVVANNYPALCDAAWTLVQAAAQ